MTAANNPQPRSLKNVEMKNITHLAIDFTQWALETFEGASAETSLTKLEHEIVEVREGLRPKGYGSTALAEEYADCLMCLFDSAARVGIAPEIIAEAFAHKLEKNKKRVWLRNADGTYSHLKTITKQQ